MCSDVRRGSGDVPSSGFFSLAGICSRSPWSRNQDKCWFLSFCVTELGSLSQTQSDLRDPEVLRGISVMEGCCVVWKKACLSTKERLHVGG